MPHVYSNFKNKAIPYAKVGRRVFTSLFDAEEYCTKNGLDVNTAIEYREDQALKDQTQEIAKYQKAILREVQDRLDARCAALREQIDRDKAALETCHHLEDKFYQEKLAETCAKSGATYEAREIVWAVLEDLEKLTGWHD
jgi:uncharacterized small protein (DUF1192 family)